MSENILSTTPTQDPLDELWRTAGSVRLTIILLLVLAGAVFVSLLVPRAPRQVQSDPNVYTGWIADLRQRYGPWTDALSFIGLTDIYSTLWFRTILALLALNLVVAILDCLPALWQVYRSPADALPDPSFGPLRQRTVEFSLPIGVVFDTLTHALSTLGYTISGTLRGDRGFKLLATRGLPRILFGIMVRVGIVIVLTGLLINERVGWRASNILFRPGQVYLVGHGKDWAVRAESFCVLPSTGRAVGMISFLRSGTVIRTVEASDQTATRYDGIYLTLRSVGPALEVTAADANGRTLLLQSPETGASPHARLGLLFTTTSEERFVIIPERNLVLRLVYTPGLPVGGTSEAPYFRLEAFHGDEASPFMSKIVSGSTSLVIESDLFHFQYQPFGILEIGREPGAWLVGIGLVVVLVGVTGALWVPSHLLWAHGVAVREGVWVALSEVLRRDVVEWKPQSLAISEVERALQCAVAVQTKGRSRS